MPCFRGVAKGGPSRAHQCTMKLLRQKTFACAVVNRKKAYDSVPHDWILYCLNRFGVHTKIVQFLGKTMSCWTTTLTDNGASLGKVPIKRGIFQDNSLSLLSFIMCLDPLSKILEDTQKGYHWSQSSVLINYLVSWMMWNCTATQNVKLSPWYLLLVYSSGIFVWTLEHQSVMSFHFQKVTLWILEIFHYHLESDLSTVTIWRI